MSIWPHEGRFRKKPVEIDAARVGDLIDSGFGRDFKFLPDWVRDAYEAGVIVAPTRDGFTIKTLEGDLHATRADMLIRGVKGELYPCKIDIFQETYEPA